MTPQLRSSRWSSRSSWRFSTFCCAEDTLSLCQCHSLQSTVQYKMVTHSPVSTYDYNRIRFSRRVSLRSRGLVADRFRRGLTRPHERNARCSNNELFGPGAAGCTRLMNLVSSNRANVCAREGDANKHFVVHSFGKVSGRSGNHPQKLPTPNAPRMRSSSGMTSRRTGSSRVNDAPQPRKRTQTPSCCTDLRRQSRGPA